MSDTASFPIYILRLGGKTEIVAPEDRADIGHTDFWEQTVSHMVAKHFGVPQRKLANLPYCQRRARVVGTKVYYGEKQSKALLTNIKTALDNDELVFAYDDHEKRLKHDVRQFRRLVGAAGK